MEVTRICKLPGGSAFLSQGFSVTVTEADIAEAVRKSGSSLSTLDALQKFSWLSYTAEMLLFDVVCKANFVSQEVAAEWYSFVNKMVPSVSTEKGAQ